MIDRFRSILAVYDDAIGSDDVLVQSIKLARATDARLSVVKPLGDAPLTLAAIEEERRRLTRMVPWITKEGVEDVSTDVLVGTPHVEIVRQVVLHDHDLVIASAKAQRGIKDVFLGSTATHLMRKCPCAVWLRKPERATRSRDILVAVDAPVDQPVDPVNVKALELGAALARAQGAGLNVVHSWDVTGSEAEMLKSEIRDYTKLAILDKHMSKHRDALETLLAELRDSHVNIDTHLPRGDHQLNTVALADQLNVGVIVMGTSGRGGLPGLLSRNCVELVLEAADCDVLAVKADGYSTPRPVERATMRHATAGAGGH